MSIVWVGNSANSQLKVEYDEINNLLSQIDSKIDEKGCDNLDTLKAMVDELYQLLDDTTGGLLNTATTATQKITNVVNCISAVDPNTQQSTLATMLDSAHKALSGSALQPIKDKANEILQQIDDATCEELDQILADAQQAANNIKNKINEALAASVSVVDTDNAFAQAVGKIASLINCLNAELMQDEKLASTVEMLEPTLKGVVSVASEAARSGVPKSQILKDANNIISQNLDVDSKYSYATNKLADLFG